MNRPQPKKKRTTLLMYYPLTALICAICVCGFALLYKGGATLPRTAAMQAEADGSSSSSSTSPLPEQPPSPTPAQSTPAPSSTGRLLPYAEGSLWGYKNTAGEIVLQAQYLRALEFDEQIAFAAIEKDGSLCYGLLNRKGIWLVEPCWSNVRMFSCGFAAVEQDEKWGFIDRAGKTVIPFVYREAGDFHCGRAAVRPASTYGYIDPDGILAIEAQFDEAGDFSSDMAFVKQNGKQYIIDKLGRKITTLGDQSGETFSEEYALLRNRDGTVRFYNHDRKRDFDPYDDARSFSNAMAAIKADGLWGFITLTGTVSIKPQFLETGDFSEGFAAVKNEANQWGYINRSGSLIIPYEYDAAEPFKEGVAIVRKGGQTGIVAKDATFIPLY